MPPVRLSPGRAAHRWRATAHTTAAQAVRDLFVAALAAVPEPVDAANIADGGLVDEDAASSP